MIALTLAELAAGVAVILGAISAAVAAATQGWFGRKTVDSTAEKTDAEADDLRSQTLAREWRTMLEGQRETYENRFALLSQTLKEQAERLERQAIELADLREEVKVLRIHAIRYEPVEGASPMHQYFDEHWHDLLSFYAERLYGVRPVLHPDNVDEATVTGYKLVPVEEVPPTHALHQSRLDRSRRAQQEAADTARRLLGYEPVTEPEHTDQ